MEPLALKDIHLPSEVAVWPLAPGWWLLIGLLVLIAVAVWLGVKRYRRGAVLREAQQMLASLRKDNQLRPAEKLAALSGLMRRVAISTAPRNEVASLTGNRWLMYLDQGLKDAPFSQGPGRCLAESPYRSEPAELDAAELAAVFECCQTWIKARKLPRRNK